jgi:hypothetical protein
VGVGVPLCLAGGPGGLTHAKEVCMMISISNRTTSDVSQEGANPTAALLESGNASPSRAGVAAAMHREARRALGVLGAVPAHAGARLRTEEAR